MAPNLKAMVAKLAGKSADAYGSAKGAVNDAMAGYQNAGAVAPMDPRAMQLGAGARNMVDSVAASPALPAAGLGAGAGLAAGAVAGNAVGQDAMMQQQEQMQAEQDAAQQAATIDAMGKKAKFDPTTQTASITPKDIDAALKQALGEANLPQLTPEQYSQLAQMANMQLVMS